MTVISSCARKSIGPTSCTNQPSSNKRRSSSSAARGRPCSHTAAEAWPNRRIRSSRLLRPVCAEAAARVGGAGTTGLLDNSGRDGGVGVLVDDDEAAHGAVHAIRIEKQRQRGLDVHFRDVVHVEARGRRLFERVDVDAVPHLLDAGAHGARGVLQQINFVQVERIGVHPDERGLEFACR